MVADSSQVQRRRGSGRPFVKGQSGNPGGRIGVPPDVRAAAQKHTEEAIATLVKWMQSNHPSAAPYAASTLLDRGWGKPSQPTELSGEIVKRVISGEPLTPEQWKEKYGDASS